MGGIIEKLSLDLILDNCPPTTIAAIIVVSLALWAAFRINKVVREALSQEQRQSEAIEENKKQRKKIEALLCDCPCISKNNGLWLQDKNRNGGRPPEPIRCHYYVAKGRDEK